MPLQSLRNYDRRALPFSDGYLIRHTMWENRGGTSVNTIAQDAFMLFEFRSEDYRSLEETYLEETIAKTPE